MSLCVRRISALILLCCLACGPALAQSNEELEAIGRHLDQLQQSGQYAEALPVAEQLTQAVEKAFGEKSAEYSAILARRGGLLQALGRYPEAEASFIRSREMATIALGPEHLGVSFVINDLALLYKVQGRFAEAEPLYQKALEIRERTLGTDHVATALVVSNLAALYVSQGRFQEAEPLFARAIATTEKVLKPDHPEVAKNLNNLATLYWSLGRFADAEPLYKRALAIVEAAYGSEHPSVSTALNNLAALYQDQGRNSEAEPLFQRSLAIREKALGPNHRDVGESANSLAWFYHQAQHRYADAEPLYQRAINITEKALGPGHATVGALLNNLAVLYYDQGRYAEAEPLFKRAITVRQGALGAKHSDVGQTMYRLARLYVAQRRLPQALQLHQRGLAIRRGALGPDHPDVIQSIDGIANTYEAQGNWQSAAASSRQARDLIIGRAKKGALTGGTAGAESGRLEIAQGREVFARLVRTLWGVAEEQPARRAAVLREGFLAVHWAEQTQASAALAQMSLRQARGTGALSQLVRERQDLARQWQALDRQLYASIAQSAERRIADAETRLRDQLAALDTRRGTIDDTLKHDFPEFFALSSPEPVSVEATRSLLKADEALVQLMISDDDVFVWAITKSGVRWFRSKLGARAIAEHVTALRCGLDYTAWNLDECAALLKTSPRVASIKGQRVQVLPFDLVRAYDLYTALFEPIYDLVKDKQLLVIPAGALARLPFHVLTTVRPNTPILTGLADYRKVEWLGMRQSITVLPSVAALKALRQFAKASRATKTYLGVGDPLLNGRQDHPQWGNDYKQRAQAARDKQQCNRKETPQLIASSRGHRSLRGFTSLYRGGQADIAFLREQDPLPETADELCEVGRQLGVPENQVLLGESATEKKLKDLSDSGQLADYAILHFATHGALSGQVIGATEPGLILTPPDANTDDAKSFERDDGYLTASEIATLRLDADWVILSACNTAAASGDSSEALSGLARAFFYAGTRALLVSHWEVYSDATVKLITTAVREMARDRKVGRAEALRRSMLALVNKGEPQEAHPAYWAPFVVVGEGSAVDTVSQDATRSVTPAGVRPASIRPNKSVRKSGAPKRENWAEEYWKKE